VATAPALPARVLPQVGSRLAPASPGIPSLASPTADLCVGASRPVFVRRATARTGRVLFQGGSCEAYPDSFAA